MVRVVISEPADRDIQSSYDWWRENRSIDQATRWYAGVYTAIESLRSNPDRCPNALEGDLLAQGARQLLYGLGRRPTHRIVFAIEGDDVVILRVRHTSQDVLTRSDIDG